MDEPVLEHTASYAGSRGRSRPIDVFEPAGGGTARAAVVLFHGGAWKFGDRSQFHPQCRRLAAAGFVAATASYDLSGTILDCVMDARAAVDRIVERSDEWRIDPTRLAVGGGSAGGHLAACLVTCPDARPAVLPAAAVLYNPVVDFAAGMRALGELAPEIGIEAERISPMGQDLSTLPPTIIFHGDADILVPIDRSQAFRDKAVAAGAQCELVEHPGRDHGFFNPVPPEFDFLVHARDFDTTTTTTIEFLTDVLGKTASDA